MALGAVAANGGDGTALLRSVLAGERARGESEREERAVGAAWRREGGPGRRGRKRQEAGGGRGACVRASGTRHPPGRGRKTTGEEEVGWAGTGPGQVGCTVGRSR